MFFSIITMIFSSCVSSNKGFQSSPVISRNVELDPIKADIIVDEKRKLKGGSSATYFLFFRINGDNVYADGIKYSTQTFNANPFKIAQQGRLNKVRSAAAYKAITSGDYDVLVHPNYSTTVEDYFFVKKYAVTVEGYGAKYSNFRTERQKVIITGNNKEYIIPDID